MVFLSNKNTHTTLPGFKNLDQKFESIIQSKEWIMLQEDFNYADRILLVGNGGNLAVCDHGAIDISRLTSKSATAPGSGILASSLINDLGHDLWVKNWLRISLRGLDQDHIKKTLLVGVTSSGYSKNICNALDNALELNCRAALISAAKPKIEGKYNRVTLNVDHYHTGEVLTLALFYQLIHGSGYSCPPLEKEKIKTQITDYEIN